MNGIFGVFFGIFTLLHPSAFSEPVQNITQAGVYESRVAVFLSFFGERRSDNWSRVGDMISNRTATWKKERQKNILPALPQSDITLRIWTFNVPESVFTPSLGTFTKTVPHVFFDIKTFTNTEQYHDALLQGMRLGSLPDIFMVYDGWMPTFRRSMEAFPRKFFSPEECRDFFFSFTCSVFSQGKTMIGLPLSAQGLFLIGNREKFFDDRVAAGNEPYRSWDGFFQNGVSIKKYSPNTSLIPPFFSGDPFSIDLFRTLILQSIEIDPEVTTESIAEILEFLKEISEISNTRGIAKGDAFSFFTQGKSAALLGNKKTYEDLIGLLLTRSPSTISGALLDVFPVPQISNTSAKVFLGKSWGMGVPRSSPKKKAALAFLTFLAEEENMRSIAEESGMMSARIVLTDHGIFRETALRSHASPFGIGTRAFENAFWEQLSLFFEKNPNKSISATQMAEILFSFFESSYGR